MSSELSQLDGGRHMSLGLEQLGQKVQTWVGNLADTNVRFLTAAGVAKRIAGSTQQPEQCRLSGRRESYDGGSQHALPAGVNRFASVSRRCAGRQFPTTAHNDGTIGEN
jgi:hypothetical protein